MKSAQNLASELAKHYGVAPKRENESQEDFENRVKQLLNEAGVSPVMLNESAQGKLALMAIYL